MSTTKQNYINSGIYFYCKSKRTNPEWLIACSNIR